MSWNAKAKNASKPGTFLIIQRPPRPHSKRDVCTWWYANNVQYVWEFIKFSMVRHTASPPAFMAATKRRGSACRDVIGTVPVCVRINFVRTRDWACANAGHSVFDIIYVYNIIFDNVPIVDCRRRIHKLMMKTTTNDDNKKRNWGPACPQPSLFIFEYKYPNNSEGINATTITTIAVYLSASACVCVCVRAICVYDAWSVCWVAFKWILSGQKKIYFRQHARSSTTRNTRAHIFSVLSLPHLGHNKNVRTQR